MTQKKFILTAIIVYLIGAAAAFAGSAITPNLKLASFSKSGSAQELEPTIVQEPATEECPINGQMLGKSLRSKWENRRPLAVVIENHEESRPQSGISQADVVYEAVSEGGVTRTLSIFYCKDAKTVGPVRSARTHFITMLREWGNSPLYAHVGGANCDAETGSGCGNGAPADALGQLNKMGWTLYNDLNEFAIPYPYYYRDYERLPDVATEHTMYSSTSKLWDYAAKKRGLTQVDEDGVRWDKGWKPWKFADDAGLAARGTTNYISYDFYDVNSSEYGVTWQYDKSTNTYKRFNGGKPHLDYNTKKQLEAKNVIVVSSVETPAYDDYPGGHILYRLVGDGDAYVFQNGQKIKSTWEKDDLDSKMKFFDEKGKEIEIVRGQVWISVIPDGNEVYSGAAKKAAQSNAASPSAKPTAAKKK